MEGTEKKVVDSSDKSFDRSLQGAVLENRVK